jgi:hypothetical protein
VSAAVAESSRSTTLWKIDAVEHDVVPEGALNLKEVAERTGLKPTTVLTAMHSSAHTGERARMRRISRPAYNVKGTPYWTEAQVADYHEQVASRFSVTEEFKGLVVVDALGAVQLQATGLHGLSRLSGVPVTTLHRWKLSAGWPKPIAIMRVNSPTPRVLYGWPQVRACMLRDHPRWFAERGITEKDLYRRQVTRASV